MSEALTETDREALERALVLVRADWSDEVIDDMLQSRGWEETAIWAAGTLQVRNLRLKPWQAPPSASCNAEHPRDVYGQRPGEGELLRKLLMRGISRYEPDPIAAIAA